MIDINDIQTAGNRNGGKSVGETLYKVTVGEVQKEYAAGTTYREIAEDFQKDYDARIVLAMVDNKLN